MPMCSMPASIPEAQDRIGLQQSGSELTGRTSQEVNNTGGTFEYGVGDPRPRQHVQGIQIGRRLYQKSRSQGYGFPSSIYAVPHFYANLASAEERMASEPIPVEPMTNFQPDAKDTQSQDPTTAEIRRRGQQDIGTITTIPRIQEML
ncbi:hypothetical protein BS47DRAFT_1386149 [Hydnum rufescens UP504]|uniref:Uncharacterized protein n=1 Tax=Hydnum rufescens UP504 TaxID=1448309 RepID=A0A9P6AF72_9AGAM|nr:hypothetical protein BS47DRAFT_1386149 [Hydnum rufescens UP504]